MDPLVLSFRFHFYPADPTRLGFNGKCMLFQQLKRDLIHGRLYCSPNESAALGALIVQGKNIFYLFSKFRATSLIDDCDSIFNASKFSDVLCSFLFMEDYPEFPIISVNWKQLKHV